jgi:hypothetical protein
VAHHKEDVIGMAVASTERYIRANAERALFGLGPNADGCPLACLLLESSRISH